MRGPSTSTTPTEYVSPAHTPHWSLRGWRRAAERDPRPESGRSAGVCRGRSPTRAAQWCRRARGRRAADGTGNGCNASRPRWKAASRSSRTPWCARPGSGTTRRLRYTVPTEHRVDEQPGQLRVAAEFEKGVAVPSADLVSRFMGFGSHGAGRRSSAAEVISHQNRSGRPSCGPGWPCARRAGVGCPRR